MADNVRTTDPNRVVVNREGEALRPSIARKRHGVEADIIFVRKDGWTLGAPAELASVAERMWRDEWVGVIEKGNDEMVSYESWALARGVKT